MKKYLKVEFENKWQQYEYIHSVVYFKLLTWIKNAAIPTISTSFITFEFCKTSACARTSFTHSYAICSHCSSCFHTLVPSFLSNALFWWSICIPIATIVCVFSINRCWKIGNTSIALHSWTTRTIWISELLIQIHSNTHISTYFRQLVLWNSFRTWSGLFIGFRNCVFRRHQSYS